MIILHMYIGYVLFSIFIASWSLESWRAEVSGEIRAFAKGRCIGFLEGGNGLWMIVQRHEDAVDDDYIETQSLVL